MRRSHDSRFCALGALALAALLAFPSAGPGQEATPPAPDPAVIPTADLANRADALRDALRRRVGLADEDQAVSALRERLPTLAEEIEALRLRSQELLAATPSIPELSDATGRWNDRAAEVGKAQQALTARTLALEEAVAELEADEAVWSTTRKALIEQKAPREAVAIVDDARAAILETRDVIAARRAEILALQGRIADLGGRISDAAEQIAAVRREALSNVLVQDAAPFWTGDFAQVGPLWEQLATHLAALAQTLGEFLDTHHGALAFQTLLLVLLAGLTLWLRPRTRTWARQETGLSTTAALFERPWAMAVVVTLGASPWIYPTAPGVVLSLVRIAALIPLFRLVPVALGPSARTPFLALATFLLFDEIRDLSSGLGVVERLLLLLECAAAVTSIRWLQRPARMAQLTRLEAPLRLVAIGLRLALGLLGAALLLNLLGYLSLARLLVVATVRAAFVALALQVLVIVLNGIALSLLRVRPLRLMRSVQMHEAGIGRNVSRVLVLIAAVVWVNQTLGFLQVRQPVLATAARVIQAEARIGGFSVSIGGVMGFALALLLGLWLARVARFVIEEELPPRVRLPRGTGHALAATAQYVLGALAFFVALTAAGIDTTNFALVAGALGVGIGFGLQNVVNNFVSGLILLFERPIQLGDAVQTHEAFGEVSRIGIRSSTIRTWQGAEIIVPNAALISERVINWTLSDRLRRAELQVGVAYGTDPEQVLELLRDVAEQHPDVLKQPAPQALFLNFGESSLDFELRAWTQNFDNFMRIKSDLAVAINTALARAGITIPFPQRDLHLKSVESDAASALKEHP